MRDIVRTGRLLLTVAAVLLLAESASADSKFLFVKARKANIRVAATVRVDDFYLVRGPDGSLGWIYDDNVIRMGKH